MARLRPVDPTLVPPGRNGAASVVPFGEGFELPESFTYEGAGPFKWAMRIDVIDGQPRCVGLICQPHDGGHISATDLHRFPLGRLVEDGTVMAARPVDGPIQYRLWDSPEQARKEQAAVAKRYRTKIRKPDRRRISDEQLDEVARIYTANELKGNPTDEVARQLHLARSTAGRWVMKAREAGKLPAARNQRSKKKERTDA